MPDSSGQFPELTEPPPRKARRTTRGLALRWLLRGLIGALVLVFVGQLVRSGWNQPLERYVEPPSDKGGSNEAMEQPSIVQGRAWKQSVVAIQSRERSGRQSHGSGFLVDDTGLVATNLHVSASCTEAVVRFSDGTTYEVAGYAAVDPAHDLALLKLKDAPESLHGLLLGSGADPPRGTKVWAVGHPEGVEFSISPGEVRRVVATSDLPDASQQFVHELTGETSGESRWIQHSASIASGSSGGPLLDEQQRVLGLNTWVDQEARFNYALPVGYLHNLLSQTERGKIEPLTAYATDAARVSQQLWQLSAARLQSLLEQGRGMKWLPQSPEDYRILQQLAWAITIARRPDALAVRGSLGDRLDELAKAADVASEQLRKVNWDEAGQVTILNEYAAHELHQPTAGLFLFATIERLVEQDGRRALIATLAGFDEPLILSLEDQLVPPGPGAQILLLGVNEQDTQQGNAPLESNSTPSIVPGLMIELH